MELIVSKKAILSFLKLFTQISDFDNQGFKHYFVFKDGDRDGIWTLMFYVEQNKWTIHGKGKSYCDNEEKELSEEDVISFIYKNRKYINAELKRSIFEAS